MADKNLDNVDDVNIEPLSDDELDSVAGGMAAGLDGGADGLCTGIGSNCSTGVKPN